MWHKEPKRFIRFEIISFSNSLQEQHANIDAGAIITRLFQKADDTEIQCRMSKVLLAYLVAEMFQNCEIGNNKTLKVVRKLGGVV